jgi:hypothetical protein
VAESSGRQSVSVHHADRRPAKNLEVSFTPGDGTGARSKREDKENAELESHLGETDLARTAGSLGDIGNHSIHIIAGLDTNPPLFTSTATAANLDSRRIYPGLASVQMNTGWEWGYYHSMLFTVTKRTRPRLELPITFSPRRST